MPISFDDLDGYTAGDGSHPINVYLDGLTASGQTQYEGVMDSAADYFNDLTNQREFNLLYFVSDGGDNNGFDPSAGNIQDLYDGSIPLEIFAFGLGEDGANDVDIDELDAVVSGIADGDPGNQSDVIDNPDRVILVENPNDVAGLFLDTIPGPELTGNILDNDDQGGDSAELTEVAGMTITGPTEIIGTFGTLVIDEDGSYTYTVTTSIPNTGTFQEVFDYQIVDRDGDIASAQLKIDLFVPQQVLVVGENVADVGDGAPGSDDDHRVPNPDGEPDGEIVGANGADVLVGDVGGVDVSFIPAKDLNIALILDTSGSMNNASGTPGLSRAELQAQATNNLLGQLGNFAADEGTIINVYIQPFATYASYGPGGGDDDDDDDDDNGGDGVNEAAVIQFNGVTGQIHFQSFDPNSQGTPNPNGGNIIGNTGNVAAALAIIAAYVNGFDIDGWTNYEDGIRQGVEWMADQAGITGEEFLNKFFFLSDGNPNTIGNFQTANGNNASDPDDALAPLFTNNGWPAGESFLNMFNGTGDFSGFDNVDISAIGIGSGVSIDNLDVLDNTSGAEIVNTAGELEAALEGGFQDVGEVLPVGGDVLIGQEGNDVIFGDVPNTDFLLQDANFVQTLLDNGVNPDSLPEGSGYEVFQSLIDAGALSLDDVRSFLANPANWDALNAGDRGEGDTIMGGAGDDVLFGQGGGDTLIGGLGDDLIDGGNDEESDVFVFSLDGFGSDTLTNFDAGRDVLRFEDVVDADGVPGPHIADVDAAIATFDVNGNDVTVNFNNGSSITIENGNPGGGPVTSIADLVNSDSQIEVDVS